MQIPALAEALEMWFADTTWTSILPLLLGKFSPCLNCVKNMHKEAKGKTGDEKSSHAMIKYEW